MKKYNLNGFTLVELAIVLVVIGLLMGMAFKGKSLIDAARLKADINKIDKLQTAINTYYSKYDTLPGYDPNSVTCTTNNSKMCTLSIYNEIIKENLLKPTDFKMTSAPGTFWHFFGCKDDTDSDGSKVWDQEPLSPAMNGLCIYRSDDPQNKPGATTTDMPGATKSSMNDYQICNIENLLDDKNSRGGDGRVLKDGEQRNANIDKNYKDPAAYNCAQYDNNKMNYNDDHSSSYGYRIF